jgi:Flp pilus assembly pilin Flp
MIRNLANSLRNLIRDERGNNLIAYALLAGAVAIAGASFLSRVSNDLKTGLNNQGSSLAETAGTTWQTPGSSSATTPSSPAGSTPAAGSPTSGSGSGNGGNNGNNGNGNGNNGNNGNGNNGNGNGNGNGGTGQGKGKGNK